jgi:hypothetical protein
MIGLYSIIRDYGTIIPDHFYDYFYDYFSDYVGFRAIIFSIISDFFRVSAP